MARTIHQPLANAADRAQAVEGSKSSFSPDKGEGNLVESPPGFLRVASPTDALFQEADRSSAKSAMEMFSIRWANKGGVSRTDKLLI